MTTSTPQNRSAARLVLVVAEERVETNPLYARDIDGDGKEEPWCNVLVTRVLRRMGVPIPEGMRANQIHAWLSKAAAIASPLASGIEAAGWEKVDAHTAQAMADQGCPAVPAWRNPIIREDGSEASGHVGILMPSLGEPGVWNAQAGRVKYTRELLQRGFGAIAPDYFVHP